MSIKKSILYSLLILLVLASGSICSQEFDVKKMDALFDTLESNNRMMGSVTLAKDGKIIYQRSLGFRLISDKEKIKINPQTQFRIGSVTKVFTAVMIHQLIEEKKLTLDTKLAKYFSQIPNADKITIAHLLSHTSGLHDYTDGVSYDPADSKAWIFQPQTSSQMLSRIAALEPDFEPGAEQRYSNTNYTLLGYIIETITNSTYDKQLSKRINNKIGLKRTHYDGKIDPSNNEAYSYVFDNGKWNKNAEQELSVAHGAGGIVSTTADMAKFMYALSTYKLINKKSLKIMSSPFMAKFPDSHLGIASFKLRGVDKIAISKQGGIDAFASDVVYVPEDRFAFTLVINGPNYPKAKIFWNVIDIYYHQPVTLPSFEVLTLPPESLEAFKGEYALKGTGVSIVIKKEGTSLSGQVTGQDVFLLEAIGENTFSHAASGIIAEFVKSADGSIQSFKLYQGRDTSLWEKLKKSD
jgi:D-alanyl-D-alanine carboxypeptidase